MKDTYRHLSRKLQHQLGEQPFPTDLLLPSRVATAFAGHVGFPEAADSIAYEPVQSLLAVSVHLWELGWELGGGGWARAARMLQRRQHCRPQGAS